MSNTMVDKLFLLASAASPGPCHCERLLLRHTKQPPAVSDIGVWFKTVQAYSKLSPQAGYHSAAISLQKGTLFANGRWD
ncbi:MAG: hypothetical protein DI617_01765 [Streptococcus pyogenes]|nr:MAG: hypothetical protein DI617_01765 [Streptococcus pyogenes]